jgi:hypothetical protein
MNTNSLLISEPPLILLPTLAKAIGLNEAIVLQRLHELLNKLDTMVGQEGHNWVCSTYEQWHENFPFWCTRTIIGIFLRLEKAGLIITAQFDKGKWDQTKYYRIDYQALGDLSHYLLDDMSGVKNEP